MTNPEQAVRIVEVYGRGGGSRPGWEAATGLALGDRLILTAAHPLSVDDPDRVIVVRGDQGLLEAELRWSGLPGEDIALVRARERLFSGQVRALPVVGRFHTDLSEIPCWSSGFPSATARPQQRELFRSVGSVTPGFLSKSGRIAFDVRNAPAARTWAGMSGAPLVCNGLVAGLVTTEPSSFDGRRLYATSLASVIKDDQFRAVLNEDLGVAPPIRAIEYEALQEYQPLPDTPAAVLRADWSATPFRSRPELQLLVDWCLNGPRTDVMLVHGAGGRGKSRIARELGEFLGVHHPAWSTVFLADAADIDLTPLRHAQGPVLCVIDYAESRTEQVAQLAKELTRSAGTGRMLLLARTAGGWTEEVTSRSEVLARLEEGSNSVLLGVMETSDGGREAAWRETLTVLPQELSGLPDYDSVEWDGCAGSLVPPDLSGERYSNILAVQIDALACLLRAGMPDTSTDEDALAVLARHERRYWDRTARARRESPALSAADRADLVVHSCLWLAQDLVEARALFVSRRGLGDVRDGEMMGFAAWLQAMYPGTERLWRVPQPDRLAEYFVEKWILSGRVSPLEFVDEATPAQLLDSLTMLARTAANNSSMDHVLESLGRSSRVEVAIAAVRVAPRAERVEPFRSIVDRAVESLDEQALVALHEEIPAYSDIFAGQALVLAERLVGLAAAHSGLGDRKRLLLARRLFDLSRRAANVGLVTKALGAGIRALDVFGDHPGKQQNVGAAATLLQLSGIFANLGRPDLAVRSAGAAVVYARSDARVRGGHRPSYLAEALDLFSVALAKAGEFEQAVAAATEALRIYRCEAAAWADQGQPAPIAAPLTNLAVHLEQLGRRSEAVAAAEEAVALLREAAPDELNLHQLATAEGNLGTVLRASGAKSAALQHYEMSASHWRKLSDINPGRHATSFAIALSNLSNSLSETGQTLAAASAAEQAVSRLRQLRDPERANVDAELGTAVHNLALRYAELGRPEVALPVALDATSIRRKLAQGGNGFHLANLASSLINLAARLTDSGREAEALETIDESIALRRALALTVPAAHLPELATALANKTNALVRMSRIEEAYGAGLEAAEIRRELFRGERSTFAVVAAASLMQLAFVCIRLERFDEALGATTDAETVYRDLAQRHPNEFLPLLRSSTRFANILQPDRRGDVEWQHVMAWPDLA